MGSGHSDEITAKRYFQGEIGNSPLVNKLGITKQILLDKVEAYYVEYALLNGLSDTAKVLSPDGLRRLHYELFGEIYDWVGQYRTYTTGRGLPFCRPEFIEKNLIVIYKKLNDELIQPMTKDNLVYVLSRFIGELNSVHPFIDGNGRT